MDEFDVRARYLDLDDRTEELNDYTVRFPNQSRDFAERLQISWIYHENALEGVVLTYHEIKAAIDRKVVSDVNLIPTYQEIKNHNEAIAFIREAARAKRTRVNLPFIRKVHSILVDDLERVEAGRYRREIPLHRTYFHEIAQPGKIPALLDKLLLGAATADFKRWHPVKQAAAFHHEFMGIFPFPEHSGKVGRLLMNFFLLRASYLPAIIHSIDRQRYYESLRQTPLQLRELLIEAMENSLESGMRCFQGLVTTPTKEVASSSGMSSYM